MAYMNPQQWRDSLIGIGQGRRATVFEDPNETDPNEILRFTGPALDRGGAPNLAGSRAASGTYNPVPVQQASAGTGLTSLQKGLEQFNQQQGGFGGDRSQVAAAPGVSAGGMPPFMANINPGLRQLSEATVADSMNQAGGTDDPQGMMSKIGGFLRRPGGARDLGGALTSLGAGMAAESSRPGGSALAGFASGAQMATQSLARSREEARLEEERAVVAAERAVVAAERARETKVREDLQAAIAKMAETGELTPDQIQIAEGIASSDPAAGLSVIAEFRAENTTTTFVDSFLTDLPPDVLEKLEASGQADLLRAPSSVFANDQKLDMMMTHGSEITRQENAIDSLLWKLHNIDDRSLASPEQLEQAEFISRNAEYTELMLRSPLNWKVIDDGNQVHYYRDDILVESFDKAVDDPVVSAAAMARFEEFYNNERATGRRELYTWKRGIDAVDRMKDDAFGLKAVGLKRAWKAFQDHVASGADRGQGLAILEGAWAQLGFANLSAFVGPTSDYEFGIAQALSGTRDLTRAELKKHMTQLYRQKLDDIAIHNDDLLKQVPDQEIRDRYLIRLSPEDFHKGTRTYYDDRLGSEQSTEGHRILLSGVRSWTGALQDLAPDRVPRPDAVPRADTVPADSITARPDSVTARPDSVIARPDSLQAMFDTLSASPDSVRAPQDAWVPGQGGHRGRNRRMARQLNGLLNGAGGEWVRTGEERGFGNPLQRNMFKWERRDEFGKLLDTKWVKDEDVPWLD
tara:strand:+ start:104 stop:2344 length:2241 start_codon:yes stop_codon:yes gene_type:complete